MANELKAVEGVINKFERELVLVSDKLTSKLSSAVGKADPRQAVDAIRARQQVATILSQSGYNEWVDDLLTKGYQELIDDTYQGYLKSFGEEFLFQDLTLQELDQLKSLDFSNYASLSDNAQTELSRVIINRQFGAITEAEALDSIRAVVSFDNGNLMRHTKTWLNTGTRNFYNDVNVSLAKDNGIEWFVYRGPKDNKTRPFGMKYIGHVGTIEQWDALTGPPRDPKAPLPVHRWLTGWNHRGVLGGVSDVRARSLPKLRDKISNKEKKAISAN